ncbi:putative coenzyme Q biosynthesis-related protein [Coleophoma crateriformis]|uniref:Ubiquinone biosynthesis protein n=1 Tax=Coleophoma crateriformis TaxID=565419 RepID=A0A3D8RIH3_9HELO|nr:putative coenzyme Q biosynthesis-related protein [Coleophoma crateriformis]
MQPLRRRLISSSRLYHSYDHPAPPAATFNQVETAILDASLPHIPTYGFTQTTLLRGARDAGYLDASTNIFPRGPFTLIHYHLVIQRLSLAKQSHILQRSNSNEQPLSIASKVKALTWARLMGNKDIVHRWQEALALMAQPTNVTTSVVELSSLADEIWFLSGDTSVDSSWYTKRASLSTIYASTEVFMTTDKSHGFEETRNFMDRRFSDAQNLGVALGSLNQWVGFTAHAGLNILRSKGIRL